MSDGRLPVRVDHWQRRLREFLHPRRGSVHNAAPAAGIPGTGALRRGRMRSEEAVRARGNKIRHVASEAARESPADAEPVFPAARPGSAGHATGNGAPSASRQAGGDQRPDEKAPAQRPGRGPGRRALKNWRVRSRLLLLIAMPTVAALIFGGFSIFSSVRSAQTYQRVEQVATLGRDVTLLAQSLEDERDQTVYYIALGGNGGRANGLSGSATIRAGAAPELAAIHLQYEVTNAAAAKVTALARQIGSSYPAQTQQAAVAMQAALAGLRSLRDAATSTQLPLLVVVQKYAVPINAMVGFTNDIAQGAGDPALAQTVSVLALVSVMAEDASQQRGLLTAALIQGKFTPGELTAMQDSVSSQQTTLQAFDNTATPAQLQLWNSNVSRTSYGTASADEQQALSLAANSGPSASLASDPTTPDDWYGVQSEAIRLDMGSVQQQLVGSVVSRAGTLRRNAIISAAIVGAVVFLVLALAMLFTVVVGRSMVRPLRRLRGDALKIAGERLPEMVRRLSDSDGAEGQLEVQPIDVDSTDEIGEVARAFDQVHAEAVRLASNEARLRGNVNAMFVNLSRRSQSLVERQIHLIDDLEQGEQDSDRLGSLFRLDHLATRMRRNSENLLVLAGHEAARRWTQPVALVDVLRAAVSEIEHYERVVLNVQPGIAVRGQVVNDVVHLLAELVENATAFSSAQTQVNVSGHLLNSGGVLLDITDQGVGMADDEMAQANWRLDNPPVVDVAVSRRMGLFVVARLASRHGIRVRLRPAASGGLTALIWLPDETVTHEIPGGSSGLRAFDPDSAAAAVPLYGLEQFSADGADGLGADGAGADGRAAAQAAVAAARAPRFTAIGPGSAETQPIVPAQPAGEDDLPPVQGDGVLPAQGDGVLPDQGDRGLLERAAGLLPDRADGSESDGDAGPLPRRKDRALADGEAAPLPRRGDGVLPRRGDGMLPRRGDGVLPRRGDGVLPRRGDGVLPRRGDSMPDFPGGDSAPDFPGGDSMPDFPGGDSVL